MKNITVIGTGYVGLVSGSGLADFGNKVVCADLNEKRIKDLSIGEVPFFEPGLIEIVERNKVAGRLDFSTNIAESISDADVVFIAVWTPMADDGSADLTSVMDVAKTIAKNISSYTVVATKSTVPIGTGQMICLKILQKISLMM